MDVVPELTCVAGGCRGDGVGQPPGPMGLATFVVPAGAHACRGEAAGGTPMEGVAARPLRVSTQPLRPRGPYKCTSVRVGRAKLGPSRKAR